MKILLPFLLLAKNCLFNNNDNNSNDNNIIRDKLVIVDPLDEFGNINHLFSYCTLIGIGNDNNNNK